MTTADELTLRVYLQVLEERGGKLDADELREELPKATRRPLEELLEHTMGEIKQILADVIAREISPLLPKGATEVVLVAEGMEVLAAEMMRAEELNWQMFKERARLMANG